MEKILHSANAVLPSFANSGMPSISDSNNIGILSMAKAMETVWGKRPYFHREGGSIPVVAQMQSILGIESVLAGFGLPDDNIHAPRNRNIHPLYWQSGRVIREFIKIYFVNITVL